MKASGLVVRGQATPADRVALGSVEVDPRIIACPPRNQTLPRRGARLVHPPLKSPPEGEGEGEKTSGVAEVCTVAMGENSPNDVRNRRRFTVNFQRIPELRLDLFEFSGSPGTPFPVP